MVKAAVLELTQKSVIGMRNNRGFSLIEILVVMTIIGISFGFALLAFGDFGADKRIAMSAERFTHTLNLARHQAILDSSTLGIKFNGREYQIVRFTPPNQWQTISERGVFAKHSFPENSQIGFDSAYRKSKNLPDIIIHPSGDQTPFKLQLGSKKQFPVTSIQGMRNGDLITKKGKG